MHSKYKATKLIINLNSSPKFITLLKILKMTLELWKYRMIKLITDSSDEKLVNQIEDIIDNSQIRI